MMVKNAECWLMLIVNDLVIDASFESVCSTLQVVDLQMVLIYGFHNPKAVLKS